MWKWIPRIELCDLHCGFEGNPFVPGTLQPVGSLFLQQKLSISLRVHLYWLYIHDYSPYVNTNAGPKSHTAYKQECCVLKVVLSLYYLRKLVNTSLVGKDAVLKMKLLNNTRKVEFKKFIYCKPFWKTFVMPKDTRKCKSMHWTVFFYADLSWL